MNKFYKYKTYLLLVLIPIYVFISSCSKEKYKYDPSSNDPQSDIYDLHVEKLDTKPNSFKMSETKYQVLKKLTHNLPINFNVLTTLLISEQVMYFNLDIYKRDKNVDFDYLNDIINKIAPLNEKDPYTIKQKYENNIKNILHTKFTKNSASTNLPHAFKTNSISDYASMMLDLIMLRLNYSCFKQFSPVVIITETSKYLGFIKKTKNRLDLIALNHSPEYESSPIIPFGNLLDYKGQTIRIIDAELFTIMEVFKNNIENITKLSKEILIKTADKYGFSLNNQHAVGPEQDHNLMMFNLTYYTYSVNPSKTPFDFGKKIIISKRSPVSIPVPSTKLDGVVDSEMSKVPETRISDTSYPQSAPVRIERFEI